MKKDKDTYLWRYMDFSKFVYMLAFNAFSLVKPSLFDDPLEGFCPNDDKKRKEAIDHTNVLCWHENDVESEAMWKLYSNYFKNAVAIQTNLESLKNYLPKNYKIYKVQYIDYKTEKPDPNSNLLIYKRKSFQHEREYRIINETKPFKSTQFGKMPQKAGNVLSLPFSGKEFIELINRVYVSPYASSEFSLLVKVVLNKYGYNEIEVVHSNDYMGGYRY